MTKGIPLWIWSTQLNSSATEIVNERHSPEIETSNHILTSPVQKRVNSPDINRTKGFGNFQQVLLFKNIADFAIMFHKCTYSPEAPYVTVLTKNVIGVIGVICD